MLLHIPAARLAFQTISPLRERREVFLAGGMTGGGSGGVERDDSNRSFGELADEIRTRLRELTVLMRESDYFRNKNIGNIWKTVEKTQKDVDAELAIVTDNVRTDDERFAALLLAEEKTAEVESLLATGSDESVVRSRLRSLVPDLLQRPEMQPDTQTGQTKMQQIRDKRSEALRILRGAAGPQRSDAQRRAAINRANAILQGLEIIDRDLERKRQENIATIIQDTRSKLKELLPQIKALPEMQDVILGKEFLNAGGIIEDTHTRTEALLTSTETYLGAKKGVNDTRELLSLAEAAKRRAEKLQAFLDHILSSRNEPKRFDENTGIKSLPIVDPQTGKEQTTVKIHGYYDRNDKSITLNKNLSGEKAEAKLAHERRHLLLHALEGLDAGALSRLYDSVKKSIDPKTGKDFRTLLLRLTQGDKELSIDPLPQYQLYGPHDIAAFEELLIRAADSKAGTLTLDSREQYVLDLFAAARAKAPSDSPESKSNDSGKRYSGDRAQEEAEPATEQINDKNEQKEANVPLTPRQLREKIATKKEEIHAFGEKLKEGENIIDGLENLPNRGQLKDKWRAHRKILEDCLLTINGYDKFVAAADAWQGGTMPPEELADLLNALFLNKRSGDAGSIRVGDADFSHRWGTSGTATRIEMAKEFPLDAELKAVQDHLELLDKELPKVAENFTELKNLSASSANPSKKGILELAGLEFYSINQVIESVKNVVESYSKAWQNWGQLKVSKLSNMIGKVTKPLPFGDQAAIALEMELDHKNDDIKDGYKKHLEHDLASFGHCFNEHHTAHSLFHMNLDDPNRFRATLEYMAGNGWLYEMDPIKGTVFGVHIAEFLPATWPDIRKEMYMRDLEQQNSDGEEKAAKKGKSRVDTYPDIPPMMEVLEDELKRHNFWAAQGILERAIDKGKLGETSTWASSIILNAIKHDEVTRRFFPKGLMDQLGNIGIGSPAWASTFFKLDRHKIVKFQQNEHSFEKAGTLALVMSEAEKQIIRVREASGLGPISRSTLDRIIGKVLACQIVDNDGTPGAKDWNESISIFDNNPAFNRYRAEVQNFKGTIKPEKCDDDFYNAVDNGTSESILKSAANFDTIFQPMSQGTFVHAQKANFFLEQIVFGFDQMQLRVRAAVAKGNPAQIAAARKARDTYQKMMLEKMSYVARNSWKQGTAGILVQVQGRCTDISPGNRSPVPKDYLIYELSRRGMFPSPEELKKLMYGLDTDFNKNWTAQVKEFGGIKTIPLD